MKRTSRWRRARVAMTVAIAVLIGVAIPGVSATSSASAATDGQMIYPASGTIQSRVGDGCNGTSRPGHDGIDISGQGGTPILAAYDGVIRTRAWSSGYGNYVDIEHVGGYVTRYAHMVSPGLVAPGARVARGQQIGVVGSTGNSTGAHLHFEVWRGGSVYAAINGGFVCKSFVTRGGPLPLVFPGLSTAPISPVSSADFDADGKADLIGIAADSDLHIRTGDGRGGFQRPSVVTSGWGLYRQLTHTDLNADGRADLLAVRADGLLEYYSGGAGGGFDGYSRFGFGWDRMRHVVSGADYSGDGLQDVVAASDSGALLLYRGNGRGGFSGSSSTIGSGWSGIRLMAGGDFNGDGIGDIMAVSPGGTLSFYRGTGSAYRMSTVGSGWGAMTALTGGVDYDGDGRVDLIARTSSGELYLYRGNGAGGFAGRVVIGGGWGGYSQLE